MENETNKADAVLKSLKEKVSTKQALEEVKNFTLIVRAEYNMHVSKDKAKNEKVLELSNIAFKSISDMLYLFKEIENSKNRD